MTPTNEEREAMIADGLEGPLDPQHADELALLAELLGDPSTWAEPRAGLEDDVVRSVTAAPRTSTGPARTRRFAFASVAAAAAIAVLVGVAGMVGGSTTDFEATLSATPLAPAAHASAGIVRNNAGFRIHLDARGLPRLRAGEYYQVWLKNADGTGVPVGTFSSSDGRITLWSGVSPKLFPVLSVTKEATDNVQASSGLVVLKGAVHPH